ncbi:MAG: IS21 family transposase [bacterium]|nr:IS21 family transposase [bacterium]
MKKIPTELEAKIVRMHHAESWPVGTIARQLGVHHSVVRRVLGEHGVPVPELAQRPSKVDPYLPFIQETLEKYPKLRATRLWQMARKRGYDGGVSRFREVVSMMRPRPRPEAFLRLTTLPGEQAQVDWGHFGQVTVGKATRKLMAFVMTLSYSRHTYLRFFHESHMPVFLRGHVEAFEFFGGVARTLLYDNLKSAVTSRVGDAVQWNETLLACAKHYRFGPRVAAPYRGNEKGRVERRIRYIRDNFFAAREWTNLTDLNIEARQWCLEVAAKRPWPDDTDKTVEEAFSEEQARLIDLPDDALPTFERVEVGVGKTPYVRFDRNDYSVPHAHVRQRLLVLADEDRVRVCDGQQVVAEHARSFDKGRRVEDKAHIDALLAEKRAAHHLHGQGRLQAAVPTTEAFLHRAAERGHNMGSVTARMLELLDQYGPQDLAAVMVELNERETVHVPSVRQLLEQRRRALSRPPPTKVELPSPELRELVVTPHSLSTYDEIGDVADEENEQKTDGEET